MSRFAKYGWGVLACNLAVVLWGAYVRASGSGAGCGNHWPLCQGEVIPRDPASATLIELAHRVSSGTVLLLVIGLFFWSRRVAPRGSAVRLGAALSLVFMFGEALLGAGLVLFELVAHNDSLTRALSLGAHLLNTFLLLGSLALTAWWASGAAPPRVGERRATAWLLGIGLLGTMTVGMSGAITALGDTLFPATSLTEGLRQDTSPTAHILLRLRVLHPAAAVAVGLYLIATAAGIAVRRNEALPARLARALALLIVAQWLAGIVNIVLLAPIWLQLGHLLLADTIWITLVLFAAVALADPGAVRLAVRDRPMAAGDAVVTGARG
ncbi:MAG TPA: COX15/CtaA family protein [Gemmatimonadales bacterium]